MSRYEENYDSTGMNRQRDLVLAVNEFCYLQNKTNGSIKTYTGPITMTISAQEALVTFDKRTKTFKETTDFKQAKQLFVSAPENWYVVLKNPAADNAHPEGGKAANSPDITIGKKVNIAGPVSFSLFPGQMAKTIQGHRLRSNQYLIARVYDADAATKNSATIIDADGNEKVDKTEDYFVGKLMVIKGTEVSFYMPPTGIEIIPKTPGGNDYVRDAVTLERLEYAILRDESGEKRYAHGPAVVFPKPTETFIKAPKGGDIFRALELSPISGIYLKVIAEYEENGVKHPIGEELFITGNDQMIYYPRPEHAMIQYDGKYMHHAIAIPEGEGRYILNRLTGEIKTVKGPTMYLPDPRTEVVVKRKLSDNECKLFYPGNTEVLEYNRGLSEKAMEKAARNGKTNSTDAINNAYATSNQEATLAIFEANSNISRGVSYTKPRTITLDTKYDGVVSVDIWTGYAVNVVSKGGNREVVMGPTTRLLDYDETLEAMSLSTGKPKTTDFLDHTAFLRIENNNVSDIINAQTSDFVDVSIKVNYCVNFLPEHKNKWFSVDNYVKFLCDKMRSDLKRELKQYNIEEFYANSTDIVRNCLLQLTDEKESDPKPVGRLFVENGMFVSDIEVLSVSVEQEVARILNDHQQAMIQRCLDLSDATRANEIEKKLAKYEEENAKLQADAKLYKLSLDKQYREEQLKQTEYFESLKREQHKAEVEAKRDMQEILDAISKAETERDKAVDEAKIAVEKELAEIEKAKQDAYAETVAKIMASIQPGLIEAMTAKANSDMTVEVAKSLSPYAMAGGNESVTDVVNKLMRGTSLEQTLANVKTLADN